MLNTRAAAREIIIGTAGKGASNSSRKIAMNNSADSTAMRKEFIKIKFRLSFLSSRTIN